MDRPRLIRGLRIVVSAMFGILCVLLIVLWVRSYTWIDNFTALVSGARTVTFHSGMGQLAINSSRDHNATWQFSGPGRLVIDSSRDNVAAWYFSPERNWKYSRNSAQDFVQRMERMERELGLGFSRASQPSFGFHRLPNGRGYDRWHVFVRHWLAVLITGMLTAAFGIRRPFSFSLRTLLIATTLIAAILGLIVYATR